MKRDISKEEGHSLDFEDLFKKIVETNEKQVLEGLRVLADSELYDDALFCIREAKKNINNPKLALLLLDDAEGHILKAEEMWNNKVCEGKVERVVSGKYEELSKNKIELRKMDNKTGDVPKEIQVEKIANGYLITLGENIFTLNENHFNLLSELIIKEQKFNLRCTNCNITYHLSNYHLFKINNIKCKNCEGVLLYVI